MRLIAAISKVSCTHFVNVAEKDNHAIVSYVAEYNAVRAPFNQYQYCFCLFCLLWGHLQFCLTLMPPFCSFSAYPLAHASPTVNQ